MSIGIRPRFSRRVQRPVVLGFLLALFISTGAFADERAKRIVAVVDYIGGDYRNAVNKGTVVNDDEYREMTEFSAQALSIFTDLRSADGDKAGIETDLSVLAEHIRKRSGDDAVPRLADGIKQRLISAYAIVTHPRTIPDYADGRAVYRENCAECHGIDGRGDGPAAATMKPREPAPANFLDPELAGNLSPFKAFNTITFGVQQTAMPNFSALSEAERWQAAFYVQSLRFSAAEAAAGGVLFVQQQKLVHLATAESLARMSDAELLDAVSAQVPKSQAFEVLAYLRRGILLEPRSEPLLTARTYLRQALDFYETGNRKAAYQRAVDAYLDGFELAEPALLARDVSKTRELEALFGELRAAIRSGADPARVYELYAYLDTGLAKSLEVMQQEQRGSGLYTFFNSSLIIIREGIEAALIVSAIIAVLKAMKAMAAIRYVHLGWILAVLAGALTWLVAQTLVSVSGAAREVVEGLTAIFAALVLFSVSYWLFSKAEARRWQQYIRTKVQGALGGGRIAALIGVSFLAVYREAFETVLFYQAMWRQTESARASVVWGFLLGLAFVLLLVWCIFRLGVKLPLRLFFGLSSALLYFLAFVLIGEGIRDLQAAGWFSETPVRSIPQLPYLGIYATAETLLAQAAMIMALFAALIWLWGRRSATYRDA